MENKNIEQTHFGYELYWSKNDNYGSKIIVFTKPEKTDFVYQIKTEKTWFVNEGEFSVRWIDTTDGKVYQQKLSTGHVFETKVNTPYSLSCESPAGTITESNNGYHEADHYIAISRNIL